MIPRFVWYASYGSNVNSDRFHCYIQGGKPNGSTKNHAGCEDKTLPTQTIPVDLGRQVFFAGKSESHWGSGAYAFLRITAPRDSELPARIKAWGTKREPPTPHPWVSYGRMYLITRQQFEEVVAQENNCKVKPRINWTEFNEQESFDLGTYGQQGEYTLMVRVGEKDGWPICTFTSPDADHMIPAEPARAYSETIIRGLIDTNPNNSRENVIAYLCEAMGDTCSVEWVDFFNAAYDDAIRDFELTQLGKTWFRVAGTRKREGNRREFIAQFAPEVRKGFSLEQGDRLFIERPINKRVASTLAFTNTAEERGCDRHPIPRGEVRLDQTLRVVIGAPKGSYVQVRVQNTKLSLRRRIAHLLESIIGSQPEMMRVQAATYEDMEVPICRLPTQTFDVLGISSGDFVQAESSGETLSIRTATLTDAQIIARRDLIEKESNYVRCGDTFPNAQWFLDLHLLTGGSTGQDHPPIFIDYDARQQLGISPGDCIRVTRDAYRALFSRLYFVTIPTSLAAIPLISRADENNILFFVCLIAAMFLMSSCAVLIELRKSLAT